ncbi:MAG: hypothetical protein HYU25_05500 [Candidatus Rokubacteria bacterium]|nr:hypothetical protein [Candidatus Rokubacteria bacterium]
MPLAPSLNAPHCRLGATGLVHSVTECRGYFERAGFAGVTVHEFVPGVLTRVTGRKPA